MYAIIATGGKQYKVAEGDIINVEKLAAQAGETVTFDQVVAVNDERDESRCRCSKCFCNSFCQRRPCLERLSFTDIREKPDIIRKWSQTGIYTG